MRGTCRLKKAHLAPRPFSLVPSACWSTQAGRGRLTSVRDGRLGRDGKPDLQGEIAMLRKFAGYLCGRTRWIFVFCAVFLPGVFAVQASPQSQIPTPAQLQQMVPENATIQYTRNVSGKVAVDALASKLGVNTHALAAVLGSNVSSLGPDPLGVKSVTKTASWQHTEQVSANQALSGDSLGTSVKPMAVGDTYTTRWSEGGWNYTATYTWNGQQWELTSFSAVKQAPR